MWQPYIESATILCDVTSGAPIHILVALLRVIAKEMIKLTQFFMKFFNETWS